MTSSKRKTFATIGSLTKQDLKEAYYLPTWPSSYTNEAAYRFLNDRKYPVFDCPSPSMAYQHFTFPLRNLPAAGDEVPVLLDYQPPPYLTEHWKKWLTAFPTATVKTIDQGLLDDVPIVTIAALQSIPELKHSVDPDILYKIQLKSSIPEVGAPCARHMEEKAVEYPCVVKVDLSWSGKGNRLAKNESDLSVILKDIREEHGWKNKIVFQEVIEGIKEVPGCLFYLNKSGEIYWVGASVGEFTGYIWVSGVIDWGAQEYYKNLVWDEFTIPIAKYLHKQGYFGFVEFEVIINDHGMYLTDLNPRIAGNTSHLLLAPFMAEMGYSQSHLLINIKFDVPPNTIVEKADDINNTNIGRVIVLSVASVDNGCQCDLSIFTKTREELQIVYHKLSPA